MNSNKVTGLDSLSTNTSATNKKYVDDNFLSLHGSVLIGSVSMSGQSITNLNPTLQNNNDAITKSYVDNAITLSGGLSVTGLTMQGDMDGHKVKGLIDPTQDNMAASKGYVDSNFLDLAGGMMVGDISMNGNDISNLPDVPPTDNSAASKKYVDSKASSPGGSPSTSGFLMTGDIDMAQNENFIVYNWSPHVRKSVLTSESNIKIKVASFVTDMSISQLSNHKLGIGIAYVDSPRAIKKHLLTINLSNKTFSLVNVGINGTMYSYHIHEEIYVGNDADAKAAILWQVGAKFETTKSHVLIDMKAHISFAVNEAGRYG